jgi:hypothetical protein
MLIASRRLLAAHRQSALPPALQTAAIEFTWHRISDRRNGSYEVGSPGPSAGTDTTTGRTRRSREAPCSVAGQREGSEMCMSCGCGETQKDHGNSDNITEQDLEKAAQAAGVSKQEAAENIRSCC